MRSVFLESSMADEAPFAAPPAAAGGGSAEQPGAGTGKRRARRGAGLVFRCAETDEVLLLLRRSKHNDRTWGVAGGNAEPGEDAFRTATREAREELGPLPPFAVAARADLERGKERQKRFVAFVADVRRDARDAWAPELNEEHREWRWWSVRDVAAAAASPGGPGQPPLHPWLKLLCASEARALMAPACAG